MEGHSILKGGENMWGGVFLTYFSGEIVDWKLKNPVEVQDLSKNLFLFKFIMKRDLETIPRNDPWSFDRSFLVLNWISGEEQPSELNMHYESFWVRINKILLMLRSENMARKICNIIGPFKEMDCR